MVLFSPKSPKPVRKLLLMLLIPMLCFAQEGIYLKDGSSIKISKDTKVIPGAKKLYYREPDKRRKSVKYSQLDYAAWDGKLFRTVQQDGKNKGYFLLADQHGHSLAVFVQNKTKYTGGFQSPYKKYDLAELRAGSVVQAITFTNSNRDDNPAKRREAYEMVTRNFASCQKLIDRMPTVEASAAVLAFLDELTFTPCE